MHFKIWLESMSPEHDGDNYFGDEAHTAGRDAQGFKSRTILVHMSPDQFLTLAEKGESIDKHKTVRDVLSSGSKFNSLPYLSFIHDGAGNAHVVGHEGRHRAMALKAAGVTSMPVLLHSQGTRQGDAIRWDQQSDQKSYDRITQTWPHTMHGQDTSPQSIPFPVKDLRN